MGNLLNPDKRIENLQKLAAASGIRNAAQLVDLATLSKSQKYVASLENYLSKMAAINNLDIDPAFLLGPRPEDLPEHGLIVGSLPQHPGSLVRHPILHTDAGILVTGRSGSGKSVLISFLCDQVLSDPSN